MNVKSDRSVKKDSNGQIIPEVGLVATIEHENFMNHAYVVESVNPTILRYIGKTLEPHKIEIKLLPAYFVNMYNKTIYVNDIKCNTRTSRIFRTCI